MSMTYPEEAVVGHLKADAAVNGLINGRIHAVAIPENATRPAIMFRRTAETPIALDTTNKDYKTTLTIWSWADDYDTARQLALAVRKSLMGFKAADDTLTIGPLVIENEADDFATQMAGEELPIYGVEQDWALAYTER